MFLAVCSWECHRDNLTTTNAEQYLINHGGVKDEAGNTLAPTIQMNNYGGAQNNETGNQTLQQITGNGGAQINSTIHPQDLIGTVVGGNQSNTTYISVDADGVQAQVNALSDGRGVVGNTINVLTGTATPHNCYGTSGGTADCERQWENVPASNGNPINLSP